MAGRYSANSGTGGSVTAAGWLNNTILQSPLVTPTVDAIYQPRDSPSRNIACTKTHTKPIIKVYTYIYIILVIRIWLIVALKLLTAESVGVAEFSAEHGRLHVPPAAVLAEVGPGTAVQLVQDLSLVLPVNVDQSVRRRAHCVAKDGSVRTIFLRQCSS